ncbi:hypothetical protein [Laspinema olomoucense]|nr:MULTISPECIES: hypothetical protein [unclassified Laspinema]
MLTPVGKIEQNRFNLPYLRECDRHFFCPCTQTQISGVQRV